MAQPIRCPDCNTEVANAAGAKTCSECGGVGYGKRELAQRLGTASDIPRLRDIRVMGKVTLSLCPFCGEDHLTSVPYLPGKGVWLRVCFRCGGIWFRESDLPRLQELSTDPDNWETPQEPPPPSDPTDPVGMLDRGTPSLEEFDGMILGRRRFFVNPLGFVVDALEHRRGVMKEDWPNPFSRFWGFTLQCFAVLGVMFRAREVWIFSLLSWAAVGLGYSLWAWLLQRGSGQLWALWKEGASAGVWSGWAVVLGVLCFGLITLPLSLFTGCMTVAHLLRATGQKSSVTQCLLMVMPQAHRLMAYFWLDGWQTFKHYLPGRRDRSGYTLWKVGTVGVIPALVLGHSMVGAGKHGVNLVASRPREVVRLRMGYGQACWVMGALAYFGTLFLLYRSPHYLGPRWSVSFSQVGVWLTVPFFVASASVKLFLRPFYVVSASRLYCEYLNAQGRALNLARGGGWKVALMWSAWVGFLFLFLYTAFRLRFGQNG